MSEQNTNIPVSDLREINKCSRYLNFISEVYRKMSKRNNELEEIINGDYLEDNIEELEGCLSRIKEGLRDLHQDSFLAFGEKLERQQLSNGAIDEDRA